MTKRVRSPEGIALAGVVAAVAMLGLTFLLLEPPARSGLLSELAKSALAVIPLAVFGVLVAGMIRSRDLLQANEREDRKDKDERDRALDAYRREFYADLITAYNDLKATRRILRGAGLTPRSSAVAPGLDMDTLDEQVRSLIRTQLTFERMRREMEAPDASFATHDAEIGRLLVEIEQYANGVIHEWETMRPRLDANGSVDQLAGWPRYSAFTFDEPDGDFDVVVAAMHEIEKIVIHTLREPPEKHVAGAAS